MKFLAKLSKNITFSPFPSYGSKIKEDEARLSAFSQAEMPLPKRLIIAGTFQCNARCPHCYMLQQNKEMFKEQNIMADLLFKKIMTSPFIKSLKRVTFSGGEALLNPNIFDWIDQAEKSGIKKIAIITNGLRLQDNKTVEKLLEKKNLSGFNISLDAISKEKYCRAKGIKDCDFDLICKQISRISDKFRGTSTKISGSFVTMRLDAEETQKIINFGESLGFHKLKLYAYHSALGKPYDQMKDKQIGDINKVSERIMKNENYDIDVSIKLPFEVTTKTFYCPSLAEHMCVGANGFLAPCCHIAWDKKYGNFIKSETNPINHPEIMNLREKFILAASKNEPSLLYKACRFCTRRTKGQLSFSKKNRNWHSYF